MNYAISEINKVESLIYRVAQKLDKPENSLIVCSDHGNIEDMRSKSHTLNPAFFAVWSKKQVKIPKKLQDIYSLIIELVEDKKPVQ